MQIFSANGALQLDSNDATHVLYQKFAGGTSSAITGSGAEDFTSTAVTVSGFSIAEDMIFIQPTGTAVCQAYVMPNSGGFTIFSDTDVTFRWYVFKKVTSLADPTSGYGVVLYDASSNVLFNPDVLAARIKGRITGTGSISLSGESLYGLGTFKYFRISASLTPHRGVIQAWVHIWNAARDQVSFGIRTVSPDGVQATTEAGLDDGLYIDTSNATTLVLAAPDP
tara:strand:- start:30 stop:701 length:672 start_codon:yes stop_codon:yes gene_type:complete